MTTYSVSRCSRKPNQMPVRCNDHPLNKVRRPLKLFEPRLSVHRERLRFELRSLNRCSRAISRSESHLILQTCIHVPIAVFANADQPDRYRARRSEGAADCISTAQNAVRGGQCGWMIGNTYTNLGSRCNPPSTAWHPDQQRASPRT